VLDSLATHGFRRVLVVNGHGGNQPVSNLASEWMGDHRDVKIRFHNWWNAPKTWAKVPGDRPGGLARLVDGELRAHRGRGREAPAGAATMVDFAKLRVQDPKGARELLGDGNFGRLLRKARRGRWTSSGRSPVDETRELPRMEVTAATRLRDSDARGRRRRCRKLRIPRACSGLASFEEVPPDTAELAKRP
jgi:creatinine amidohydrolase